MQILLLFTDMGLGKSPMRLGFRDRFWVEPLDCGTIGPWEHRHTLAKLYCLASITIAAAEEEKPLFDQLLDECLC